MSVPGSSAGETTYIEEGSVAECSPKTPQEILGRFVEDWLETLDKEETKSTSLFFLL